VTATAGQAAGWLVGGVLPRHAPNGIKRHAAAAAAHAVSLHAHSRRPRARVGASASADPGRPVGAGRAVARATPAHPPFGLGLRAPGSRHARPRALSRPRAVPCAHASPVASITLFHRPRPSTSLAALPTRSRCLESRPRPAPTRPATRTRRRHRRRRLLHARHEGYSFRSVPVRVPELAGRCRPGRRDGRSAARDDPEHS
jgi:hypothetical protein